MTVLQVAIAAGGFMAFGAAMFACATGWPRAAAALTAAGLICTIGFGIL